MLRRAISLLGWTIIVGTSAGIVLWIELTLFGVWRWTGVVLGTLFMPVTIGLMPFYHGFVVGSWTLATIYAVWFGGLLLTTVDPKHDRPPALEPRP